MSGIFIDFSNAFDLVDHDILLDRMEITDVKGIGLMRLNSYLSNRVHQVHIGEIFSANKSVTMGVQQGSALWANLFIISFNDIINLPL